MLNPLPSPHNALSGPGAPMCGPLCYQKAAAPPVTSVHQVSDFFTKLLDTSDFPARWHCGNWTDFHGWLYILSDLTICAAYFAIPVFALRVMAKRKDIALNRAILLFLAFVFLCGLTHLIDALIFWWPAYRLSALLRFATAIVSAYAAYALTRVFPLLMGLRSVKDLKMEIAKRKKTEARLLESELLLTEAGRIARVGGWEYDLVTHKRSYSKAVYDILEIPYDYDISQDHPLSYYPAPFRGQLERATSEAIRNVQKWDIETLAVTLSHNTLWVRHMGVPVLNAQGKVVKIRGTLTDIDYYKRHELELSKALKDAQEKSERLKKFSHILSHNIRNHTSNLTALANLAETESLNEDNLELFLKSQRVTQALTTTLDDLAQIMEAQNEITALESISFAQVTAKIIQAQSLLISQAQAQIDQNFAASTVQFPSLYLESIIQHLLANALRYRNPVKALQVKFISYVNEVGQVILECQDNGLGMDLEQYGHKLFNLYATFHPSLSARGVGLFLLKTQIESQGGEITVKSQPGEGAIFQIVFSKANEQ